MSEQEKIFEQFFKVLLSVVIGFIAYKIAHYI